MLIVATAVLFAWLLVSVMRVAVSGLRLPGLRLPGLRPSPRPPPGPSATDADAGAAIMAAPEPIDQASRPDPELDAERSVREHLYGPRSRHR